MNRGRRRVAVVLFNLGGPVDQGEVRPFLQALFSDRAIVDLPAPLRLPLAWLMAASRASLARANYSAIGGGSPLLAETRAQAQALEWALSEREIEPKVFIAMRYAQPSTESAAAAVAAWTPDDVVLAPLYPQYSTTTTASSLTAWRKAYLGPGASHALCCWHANAGLAEAQAAAILETWTEAGRPKVRLLFSAHGLPERTAAKGDPYPWQVESTCRTILERLGGGWDWRLCYQSRVGPLNWLGPSTPEAIDEAAREGFGVLIVPVSFVSEHVETLVELDRDYANLARRAGVTTYLRAPTVGARATFIDGLAGAIVRALERGVAPDGEACPARFIRCGRE